jgi:hypothetical protein
VTDPEATGAGSPGAPRRRPTRRRTAAVAVSVVIGVVVLLVGADWLARVGAQSLLSRQIQDATGVLTSPVVQVHGGPFLPQVVAGYYDTVEVELVDVSSGPLTISTLSATLTGVHLPFHDVLVRKVDRIHIDSAEQTAFLTYDDINSYLSMSGHRVQVQPAPDGEVTLTGTVTVLGTEVSASAVAQIDSRDGALSLKPTRLDTDTPLDRASEILLGQRFTLLIPLDPLPFGQQIRSIEARDDGFLVEAGGSGIIVNP